MLDWSGCDAYRDLGGMPTADGRAIRAGALLRSGSQHGLAQNTVQAIRDGAVARIVDLRWARECEEFPSPFLDHAVYRHVPMLNDVLGYVPPPDSYAPMLDHNAARIAQAFSAVADAPPGPVLVHCKAGRDRTGVLVALLLKVAGVADDVIAEDYARTAPGVAATMINTLNHLRARYGGAEPYLLAAGIAQRQLAAVRQRLVR
jgi:protein-tyrosine phosphatase